MILKEYLAGVGGGVSSVRSTVIISGSARVSAVTFDPETVCKCLLAENINFCPKHQENLLFQSSVRLICYLCTIFIVIYPPIHSSADL